MCAFGKEKRGRCVCVCGEREREGENIKERMGLRDDTEIKHLFKLICT